jgi:hypothetical protein
MKKYAYDDYMQRINPKKVTVLTIDGSPQCCWTGGRSSRKLMWGLSDKSVMWRIEDNEIPKKRAGFSLFQVFITG